ncbi:MFS transporter, AGZA family, xanthine/uracil permease [Exophiala aquamarina CBS 119918]|uniref:MFS transporter, AGZA family, xanthine/uracil permease n=1 Tax=Exophiala aquamarina CBS 119918 TaxID=1182545 RepID=A0A072PAG0_9EURO|nr:MFS transporter, AGZA family, xanthine/uracil permease [Exophiala aquamarina CBS 119918]KEF52575.1 MFS transporter, AGZA family, xanthine/uracil permease [Exophiala aquamarina CBS 119918]
MGLAAIIENLNRSIARTTFGRVFRLEGSGHEREIKGAKFSIELGAGFTTFMTMCYIIAVNASIISQTGGTCVCNGGEADPICKDNVEYTVCVQGIQRDLVTATAAIASLSSFTFGFLTNLPVCLAPGMGLNAYFTYQVVGFHGSGTVPYRLALTAVFVEGLIFVFLALTGMRQWLVKLVPSSLKIAATSGIGLFLALIGLSSTGGVGLITGSANHPTDLGGCPAQYMDEFGACTSHKMLSSTVWIGICCGGFLSAILMMYKVRGAIFYGIAIVSIMSWPRNSSFTYFPHTPEGDDRFDFFKNVVGFHAIQDTLVAQEWDLSGTTGAHFALALFTFLYVDILDATGTLYSMARFAGVVDPTDGSFPRSTVAFCTDAICISIASLFGSSPVTAFVESGAGIAEGGRTGLTAMTTGLLFFVSLFFAPIFSNIPTWATGCALVLIGCLMLRSMVEVNWAYAGDALPAAVTLLFIPFSYSVAYGLIA